MSIWRWTILTALCVVFVIWLIVGSPSFESCTNQGQTSDIQQGFRKIINDLFLYRRCIGPFLYANEITITALSTLLIAAFTAILGIFTVRLAWSTQIAAEAAKTSADAAISLERPYLTIAKMHLREREPLHVKKIVTCEYTIENYGKTPAVLAWSCVDLRCLQGLPKEPPYKNLRSWRDRIIYQRDPIGENELISVLPESDLTFLDDESAGYELFLFGYFIFYDVFGKRRKTGFCYHLDRSTAANLRVRIPAYNYDIEEKE